LKDSQHETKLQQENFTISTHTIFSYILVVIAQKHLQHQQFDV